MPAVQFTAYITPHAIENYYGVHIFSFLIDITVGLLIMNYSKILCTQV